MQSCDIPSKSVIPRSMTTLPDLQGIDSKILIIKNLQREKPQQPKVDILVT